MSLGDQLKRVLAVADTFTADDITANGAATPDPAHGANATNNGIGSLFRAAYKRGWIAPTGAYVRSKAPHRKGGAIGVWRVLPLGRRHGLS